MRQCVVLLGVVAILVVPFVLAEGGAVPGTLDPAYTTAAQAPSVPVPPTLTTAAEAPPGYVPPLPLPSFGPVLPCDCPIGAIDEGEGCAGDQYVDTFNAGCNAMTPVFSPIADGDTICGEAFSYFDDMGMPVRDTDWYGPIEITQTMTLRWEAVANFECVLLVISDPNANCDPDCSPTVGTGITVADCNAAPTAVEVVVTPGTYYVFAAPNFFGNGAECGIDGTSYVATLSLLDPPTPPAPCTCPAGATDEGEGCAEFGYVDDFNAGCNAAVPVFSAIADGETICGEASTYTDCVGGQFRDTDWYGPVVVTDPQALRWEVAANFAAICFIIQDPTPLCDPAGTPILGSITTPTDCTPVSLELDVPPGTYYLFVAPNVFGSGVDCGVNGTSYTATFDILPPSMDPCLDPTGLPSWGDNFDSYAAGSLIGGQGQWETWDNVGTDALVTNLQSTSAPNALQIGGYGDNLGDIVRVFCDLTADNTSTVTVTAMCFVPGQMTGEAYFILLNTFEQGGAKNWSAQLQMISNGAGGVDINSQGGSTYAGGGFVQLTASSWFEIRVVIDLVADTHTITLTQSGNEFIIEGDAPWTGGSAVANLELQAIDLFSNGSSGFYYDDILVEGDPIMVVDEILRGDCNGDEGFNGLVDGLFALNYQFVPGSATPPCLDQCDFDDSNSFNGLTDGLSMLNFQFVPGSPPPAPPGTTCGEDPTGFFDCATVICPSP